MSTTKLSKTLADELLVNLDESLDCEGDKFKFLMVGGASLMHQNVRQSTMDIDCFLMNNDSRRRDIKKAILLVAMKKSVPHDWLNFDVENLGIDMEEINFRFVRELNNIVIYTADNLTLAALKLMSACNREGTDLNDLASILRIESFPTKTVLSKVTKLFPNEFIDKEFLISLYEDAMMMSK